MTALEPILHDKEQRQLEVAFLGGAHDSAVGRTHQIAVEMDRRCRLVAGCFSKSSEVNAETAHRYRVPRNRVYHDLNELLERERSVVDAVVILTPTDQHASQVIQCLEAGVPVICEKALATSSREIEEIRGCLERTGGFLAVIYNYLGYPMVRELREMVQRGFFGRVQQVQLEMPQEGFERVDPSGRPIVPQEWRLRDAEVPTISLDLGVHLHMLMRYLTGEVPLRVVAASDTFGNFSNVVDSVSCMIRYTNGVHANVWYSKAALGQRNGLSVRIFGDKGSAEWIQEDPENLYCADNKGGRWILDRADASIKLANQARYTRFKAGHPAGFIEAFANYYYDVADALIGFKEGQPVPSSNCFGVEEALEGLKLFEAIARSSRSEGWERV